jgi:hypothetical protein
VFTAAVISEELFEHPRQLLAFALWQTCHK